MVDIELVIKINKDTYKDIIKNRFIYDEDNEVVTHAIKNGIPINGTNGDVIKAIFPYGKYNEYFADVEMKTEENDTRFKSVFDRDWWDEPYQKGGKE